MPSSKIFVSVLLRKLDQVDEFDEILRQNGRGRGKNATDLRSLLAYSHLDFVYIKDLMQKKSSDIVKNDLWKSLPYSSYFINLQFCCIDSQPFLQQSDSLVLGLSMDTHDIAHRAHCYGKIHRHTLCDYQKHQGQIPSCIHL